MAGNQLIKDADGKVCAAKTAFIAALAVCLVRILVGGVSFGDITIPDADLAGMAAFLTPLAGAYWGRSWTKSKATQ